MIYLGIILVSFYAGWKLREKMAFFRIAQHLKVEVAQELEDSVKVEMLIEKNGDMFYLYNKETDVFLAQGTSLEEIKPILQKTYPNCTFSASATNIKEVDFK